MKRKVSFAIAALALASIFSSNNASADVISLSLTQAPDNTYQQTTNNPCIFGPASCTSTQPSGFAYQSTPTGNTSSASLSETYTVQAVRDALGGYNIFSIGIDVQTTTPTSPATELLQQFTVVVTGLKNGVQTTDTYTYNTPTLLPYGNSGSGFADDLLSSIDLTGFSGMASIAFSVIYSSATDGPETFFLTNASNAVPEPGITMLLGAGLLGIGWARRKQSI
jgi:hypothetical protein